MKKVLERTIENRVVQVAKERWGLLSRKMNGLGFNHWPDRLFPLPNKRVLWIEFKRPGQGLTEAQADLHRRLTRLGQDVIVCDNAGEAMAALEARLK